MEATDTFTMSISQLVGKINFKPAYRPPTSYYYDYSQISFKSILSIEGKSPCDIYICLSENKYTKIIKEDTSIDHLRLMKYQRKGLKSLYIRRSDRRKFVSFSANLLDQFFSNNFVKMHSAQILLDELAQQTLREIYRDGILDEESISAAFVIVYGYQKMLEANVTSLAYLMQLANNKPEYIRHSVSTAILSILLANAIGKAPFNVITLAGLGGLLHDIGMVKIPSHIDELNPKLSLKERIELHKHPYLGSQLLEQAFNCPKGLKKVILEHHERWDGSGYPHNLSGENIHFVARIIAITDYFSSLNRLRHKGKPIHPTTIIRMMKKKNWFDPFLLDVFAKLLRL